MSAASTGSGFRWLPWARGLGREEDPVVARIAAGDPATIAEIYHEHHRALRAFAWRLVGDAATAEDVVHDTFLALPRAARSFRGECAFRTFLFALVARRAKHWFRAAARRKRAMEKFTEHRAGCARPLDTPARIDLAGALSRALDALPAEQRVTFVLCQIEEVCGAEAARVLGIPEATVRTRLFHARRKLRDELEKEGIR